MCQKPLVSGMPSQQNRSKYHKTKFKWWWMRLLRTKMCLDWSRLGHRGPQKQSSPRPDHTFLSKSPAYILYRFVKNKSTISPYRARTTPVSRSVAHNIDLPPIFRITILRKCPLKSNVGGLGGGLRYYVCRILRPACENQWKWSFI